MVDKDELQRFREQLEDDETRLQLTEALFIGTLLTGCIIEKTYKVSDSFVAPIRLTALGQEVYAGVMESRSRIKPNDVRLSLFLEFGSPAGLFVDAATDIEGLRRALGRELHERRILFPYIFGRELHDAAAERFPRLTSLNNAQTATLLKALPVGIFQDGFTTVGPWGCLKADSPRQLAPTQAVPGYLCSDPTCPTVHQILLQTGQGSSLLKARATVGEYVDRHYRNSEDEFIPLVREAQASALNLFRVKTTDTLVEVMADTLSPSELATVADRAIRIHASQSARGDLSRRLGVVLQSPSDFVESLSRPQILHLLLLLSDEVLTEAVDSAVQSQALPIPPHEVRVPILERWGGAPYDLSPEIGWLGVRYTPAGRNSIVARRLQGLLHDLYYSGDFLRPDDLAYLLDVSPTASTESELLSMAVGTMAPEEILRDLVLSNRGGAERASQFLGVHTSSTGNRGDLLRLLLWKLGAPVDPQFNEILSLEHRVGDLSAALSSGATEEMLRGSISNLFAALEDVLQRALLFTAWALTVDHFTESDGFLYDSAIAFDVLEKKSDAASKILDAGQDFAEVKLTLSALGIGFGRLARYLEELDLTKFERPRNHWPLECRESSRPFAFPSIVPFLNLVPQARDRLLREMRSVASAVQDELVLRVRNSTIHGNNPFPSAAEISLAVERLNGLRNVLRETGIYPSIYRVSGEQRDVWGRQRYAYTGNTSTIQFDLPPWPVSPGLPTGHTELVIFSAATLGASGALRFKLKSRPGGDPYWDGWPKRWSVSHEYATSDRSGDMPRPSERDGRSLA